MPSFSTDTSFDSLIKKNAIRDALILLNINEKSKHELKSKRDREIQERITTGKRKKYTDEEKQALSREAQHIHNQLEDSKLGGFEKDLSSKRIAGKEI